MNDRTVIQDVLSKVALLRTESGVVLDLHGDRWITNANAVDEQVLAFARSPVLDVGCGPGRHVESLARRNIAVLGIDVSENAVAYARDRHRAVLHRCIYDPVPDAGQWATVLLLDGNIGIGGDPVRLLRRAVSLLRVDGQILIELENGFERSNVENVQLQLDGEVGPWFPWAQVDASDLTSLAADAGLQIASQWSVDDRHFAILEAALS